MICYDATGFGLVRIVGKSSVIYDEVVFVEIMEFQLQCAWYVRFVGFQCSVR